MNNVVVLKFGGTSVASPARLRRAAARIRAHRRAGRSVVVVVSAAGQSTDHLLAWTQGVERAGGAAPAAPAAAEGGAREIDRALATGEDRSAALLALALWRLGVPARSLRGGEAGVRVAGDFGAGTIAGVERGRIDQLLEAGIVPVVSGFQGEREDGETLTLGRGGSDISAVALAAALGNVPCHIVTDVDAVYDRDPRQDPEARPFAALGYAELVALTESGAEVLHPAAARLAERYGVPLRVYHHRAPLVGAGTRVGPRRGAAGAAAPTSPLEAA
jgi:aspartate kinase